MAEPHNEQAGAAVCPAGTSALEKAGIMSRISFSWVGPLIEKGWVQLEFPADGARFLVPAHDDAIQLSQQFEWSYAHVKVRDLLPFLHLEVYLCKREWNALRVGTAHSSSNSACKQNCNEDM